MRYYKYMEVYPNLTLYRAVKNAAKEVPNNVAIYYFNNKITFAHFLKDIERWASILQNDLNVQKGDTVLIALPNIPQTLVIFYAANMIGAVCNMVHPYTPKEGIQKYYDEGKCKIAFLFDKRVYKELKEYKKFNGNIVVCDAKTYLRLTTKGVYAISNHKVVKELSKNTTFSFYTNFKNNGIEPIEYPLKDSETSVLLHSASTTGKAKTIMLSAKSFNFSASRVEEILCLSREELLNKSMMAILPTFHGFGLCMTMHAPLVNSFATVLVPKYSSKAIIDMMNKTKNVVCICGVPSVFKDLLINLGFLNNRHLKELGSCFSGGDSLPSNIKENFDSLMINRKCRCRLYEGYGLTEALSVCSVNSNRHHKFGSIGYPISGVSFKILDENNNEVPFGGIGEIAIKSENSMLGYYQNEEATKATYFDGYLKTGDLGYLDEDGFLYFNSRKKRVIKASGVAIFPEEVEAVISHIPGVKGVCAVQIPDEKLVHAIKVFVVSDNKNKEVIFEECRRQLISWSIPKEVEFVAKLPYTRYKKVDFMKMQKLEDERRLTKS